ncbi:hypothetical protein [Nocardiopsis potens]|uniref:hypothetical protein n=1 Tax=Nocardiopsis potens TaxID=1246458 RepID=UPI000344C333|nr:hypothetical protein [Nocardiopsis potens]
MAATPRPLRTSSPLPPYRAVLAVDAEGYTRNSAFHQQVLSTAIPEALEEAFRRSGLEEVWSGRRFPQSAGDGYVVGVEPEHLPFLVHPMLGHLQDALEDDQSRLAAHERELRLRLRVALDVGPLPDGGGAGPGPAGIGRAMNDVHRLLDAAPLRDELRASDRDITYLAAIVSRGVYEEAVVGRFVGLNPRRFRRVEVRHPDKGFTQEGYLYVPVQSRSSGAPGAQTAERKAEAAPEPAPGPGAPEPPSGQGAAPGGVRMGDNHGQAVLGGTLQGGMHGDFRGRGRG